MQEKLLFELRYLKRLKDKSKANLICIILLHICIKNRTKYIKNLYNFFKSICSLISDAFLTAVSNNAPTNFIVYTSQK